MPFAIWKPLYQVNTTDAVGAFPGTNEQSGPAIAALADGQFLIGWSDFTNTFATGLGTPDSVGQVLDPLGSKAGNEVHLSSFYLDGSQEFVDVAALPGGGFVAAFQSEDQAFFTTGFNIIYQTFDSSGAFVSVRTSGGPPTFADPGIFQNGEQLAPSVTGFSDGSFMVIYSNNTGADNDLLGYVVDATGVEQIAFNLDDAGTDATDADTATLLNDRAAVVYRSSSNSGDILFRVTTKTGALVDSGTVAGTASAESAPVVAALKGAGGGFAVAWSDSAGDGAGNQGIKVRLYSNDGVAAGAAFSANLGVTAGVQSAPAITGLLDGGFLVAWLDEPSNTIRARRFDAAGTAIETEFVIASLDTVSEPTLATLSDGRVVLGITNEDGTGDRDIYATIWDPRDATIDGTAADDVLTSRVNGASVSGLAGFDTLYSGQGDDTLNGGADLDTADYGLATSGVTVSLALAGPQAVGGGLGNDTIIGIERLVGSQHDDVLTGGAGTNTVNGGDGDDFLNGGTGDDFVNGGNGDDRLVGGAGADTFDGGAGNDVYYLADVSDVAVEAFNAGSDIVSSSVNHTLGANFEKLILAGAAVTGTGNASSNHMYGNNLANTLDGGIGADRLFGGGGSDVFIVDSTGDRVFEVTAGAAGGTDTVRTSVNFGLSENVENLVITAASGQVNGAGNSLANVITGGAGNNYIDGKGGADTLTGGNGLDSFVFSTTLGAGNVDTISDFVVADDALRLDDAIFSALTAGFLSDSAVQNAAVAQDADDRIIYDPLTGNLYYDADGTGGTAQVQFASMGTGLTLAGLDVFVF